MTSPQVISSNAFTLDLSRASAPSNAEIKLAHQFLLENNTLILGRNLRRYQQRLYTEGNFDPTGLLGYFDCVFLGTLSFTDKSYAWRFHSVRADGDLWIISGLCNEGYLLEGIYFVRSHVVVSLTDRRFEAMAVRYHIGICQQCSLKPVIGDGSTIPGSRVVLRIGHDNYAHFMWNELPALIACEQYRLYPDIEVVVVNEPIAPIESLWRAPPNAKITKASQKHYIPLNNSFYQYMIFSVGSYVVNAAAKDRIISAAADIERSAGIQFNKSHRFVIWISLRRSSRRCINLPDALIKLLERLRPLGATFDIIFDGWSVPDDLNADFRYDIDLMRRNQAEVREEAAGILSRAMELALPNVAPHDITSATTPVAMALARHADFYICHAGTQQHKIGWLYDVPGIVHTNVHLTKTFSTSWTAEMAQSRAEPALVPAAMIAEAVTNSRFPNDLTRRDYEIIDIDGFVDFVVTHLSGALARSPGPRPGGREFA